MIILLILSCSINGVIGKEHSGPFFASSDTRSTLVYLDHLLFVEKVEVSAFSGRAHVQYQQDDIRFLDAEISAGSRVFSGVIFDPLTFVATSTKLFIHKINVATKKLIYLAAVDLSTVIQSQQILSLHAHFDLLTVRTANDFIAFNVTTLTSLLKDDDALHIFHSRNTTVAFDTIIVS